MEKEPEEVPETPPEELQRTVTQYITDEGNAQGRSISQIVAPANRNSKLLAPRGGISKVNSSGRHSGGTSSGRRSGGTSSGRCSEAISSGRCSEAISSRRHLGNTSSGRQLSCSYERQQQLGHLYSHEYIGTMVENLTHPGSDAVINKIIEGAVAWIEGNPGTCRLSSCGFSRIESGLIAESIREKTGEDFDLEFIFMTLIALQYQFEEYLEWMKFKAGDESCLLVYEDGMIIPSHHNFEAGQMLADCLKVIHKHPFRQFPSLRYLFAESYKNATLP